MNTTELLDDYAIEVAKKVLEKEYPECVYDDICVVSVENTPYREVYFINHPKYYCIRVDVSEAGFKYGNSNDSGSDSSSAEEVGNPI